MMRADARDDDAKQDGPPRADTSTGGRALRAVKSIIKHFNSDLERRIDEATVAGNEREAYHLKEARARLSTEAHNDVTADPSKVAADLNKSLLTAAYRAHPAHRATPGWFDRGSECRDSASAR
jgi:hypothetical protein